MATMSDEPEPHRDPVDDQKEGGMRPTASRVGPSAERGVEILDAAATVFARQGYDGTSIDDIADELGATKGRVYHYYRSKADLLLGVLSSGAQRLIDEVGPLAADGDLPPDERLYRMARAHAMTMMDNHSYQYVSLRSLDRHMFEGQGSRGKVWASVVELRREYEQLYTSVIDEGRASGVFAATDTRLAVRALLGSLNWITVWFNPDADPGSARVSRDEIADRLARFGVAGMNGA
jgi:AcrR family transcriptional regulator